MTLLALNIVALVAFVIVLCAFCWRPGITGSIAFLVLTTTGCTEASQGRAHNAATAFLYACVFGAFALAALPGKAKRRAP